MERYGVGGRCSALSNYVWPIRVVRPRDGCSKGTANARSTAWPGHATDTVKARFDALYPLDDQVARPGNAMDMVSAANAPVPTELNMPAVISFRKEKTYKSRDAGIVRNELLDPTRLGFH